MDSIIFDVDGTLWDSTEIVAESWDEYLHNKEHMNITITAERLMGLFGQPLPAIAAPLRTAFHDTQRLLLETYTSNMCSDFVLFAQLMKK